MNKNEVIDMLKSTLVLDLETYSHFDIKKDFEKYIDDAKIRWIGFYSYQQNKYYELKYFGNESVIKKFIGLHKYIITFNGESFDIPILKNNNLWPDGWKNSVDVKLILSNNLSVGGKARGGLMGFKFKKDSLKEMAKTMKLETQKGDIDYHIFKKESWNLDETIEIKKYLKSDVEATNQMFDKLINFWIVFTNFISNKNIKNLSWIKSKSGALSYKVLTHIAGLLEEYGNSKNIKEEMGGLVLDPTGEEYTDVWYMDYASLYPLILIMFNIFGSPTLRPDCTDWFTGNKVFKIKGKYAKDKQHILSKKYQQMYLERKIAKKDNPALAYAYKIILNGGYGVLRSKIFKSTYYEHSGYDICWLGQQLNEIIGQFFTPVGFKTVFGDTDSRGLKYVGKKQLTIEEQYKLIIKTEKEMKQYILNNVPFPSESFNLESETGHLPIKYMMFVNDEKKGKKLKKNYCYIYYHFKTKTHKTHITGLPIKKDNATKLGIYIFKKHINPRMIKEFKGKFEVSWIEGLIKKELINNMKLMIQEYNCKPYHTYKGTGRGCLNAQISKKYFNGKSGIISLIKNKRVGRVGGTFKYCTIKEAKKSNLLPQELDLQKIYNELNPFVKGGLIYKNSKYKMKSQNGFFNNSNNPINEMNNKTELVIKKEGFFK